MTTFPRALLAALATLAATPAAGLAKEKPFSSDDLARYGCRAADPVGDPVPSAAGDAVAFFEHGARGFELVVCIRGAEPARWPIVRGIDGLRIFWINASEIVIGPARLQPKMRVSWTVSRSPA
jgi:hypothetical protein